MLKFCTVYDVHERERVPSCCGRRAIPSYKMHVLESGAIDLEQTGVTDLYLEIQSHRDSVDLHSIIKRFEQTGDTSAFEAVRGFYGDVTMLPKNNAELMQRVIDAESLFSKLDPGVKSQFNNSASEFFASIGSDKFMKIFNISSSDGSKDSKVTVEKAVEKEVVINE